MSFANNTPFPGQDVPAVDREGRDVVVAIVKSSYVIDQNGRVFLAPEPSPVRLNEVPFDPEAEMSSLLFPSDVADIKHGMDLVVVGEAVAPQPVEAMDVGVSVPGLTLALRVHGPRVFYKGLGGLAIGPAAKFERAPLIYENAYGGLSEDLSEIEPRNPVGRGVYKHASELEGKPAPQIEHPARPHKSGSDHHPPVGLAAIPSYWAPRKDYFGSVDDQYKEDQMPLMPADFDIRYNNVAHPDLVLPEPLPAGSRVGIVGMHEDGPLSFELPEFRLVFTGVYADGSTVSRTPAPDTLLIQPSLRHFELVSRASFALNRTNLLCEIRADRA